MDLKVGKVIQWESLSPILATFRLAPQLGSNFPDYRPGQYIALRRERCRLTRLDVGPSGERRWVPDVDASGAPKLGPVTHPFSIASAPSETHQHGYLEFCIVLQRDAWGTLGRLSRSLFELDPPADDEVLYAARAAGSFTLDKRAQGFPSVLFIASGTGIAPLVSMVKELHFRAGRDTLPAVRYTLIHANRSRKELAFRRALLDIEAAGRFDFVYLGAVSRPAPEEAADQRLGLGRANNLLRHILDMPLQEEEQLKTPASDEERSVARAAMASAVAPALPPAISKSMLQQRLDPERTVVLTCGNPMLMADVEVVARRHQMRFEKEEW
jgi:ferredoxin-NADP reductase